MNVGRSLWRSDRIGCANGRQIGLCFMVYMYEFLKNKEKLIKSFPFEYVNNMISG